MKKLTLAFLVFSGIAFAQEKDPVVAKVNNIEIKRSQLEQAFAQNMMFVSDKVVTKEKVLFDLINRELGISRAKSLKLEQDPVVKQKMEDVLYHAQVSKDLEPKLKKIVVTDEDVKRYYADFPEYRTAHILLRVRAQPDENEWMAAQNKALQLFETLKKKPESFSELANKYSQSSTAPTGGDMGFQPAVKMPPEYFQAIKGKSKDYISPPVRTQFGYHIIKVLGVKDFNSINKELYKKIVYDQKRDKILDEYFSELRSKATIAINKQYLE
ncbi:MAG: peptidylprolyl isomerase [Bdellovibrio sp.]